MKNLVLLITLIIACTTQAQNFVFNQISCPELPEDGGLGDVYLSSSGKAIFTGRLVDAYYDGSVVSTLASINEYSSDITAIEEDGKIIAYSFRDGKYLYKWNDSTKTWEDTKLWTPMYNNDGEIHIISSTNALCCSYTNDDSLFLWRFNIKDTTFTLLKKIASENDQAFGVINVFKRESNALVVLTGKNKSIILSYDYDSIFTEIDVIPFRVYDAYLFDNNFFYFAGGEYWEKIIKWNSTTLEEEVIYTNSDFFIEQLIILSNNEIIFSDYNHEKIKMLTISTGNVETLYNNYFPFSSYNEYLKKAIFVKGDFIVEMTIADGIISFTDVNPIKLYPNPATDKITLVTEDQNINTIEIFNNLGQKVLTPNILDNSIDISSLTKGIYFMRLSFQNGELISKKFVKN
jgi:hypothetical protein